MSRPSTPTAAQARRRTAAIVLLPALVLATAYVYFPRARVERRVAALERSIQSAREQAPTLAAQAAAATELDALRRTAGELRRAAAPVESDTHASPASHTDAVARAATVENVLLLLAKHGLTLTEESTGPLGVEAAASPMLRGARGPVRTLRFRGRYFDVLAALEELVGSDAHAFPLQLEMKRSRDAGGALLWTLVLI